MCLQAVLVDGWVFCGQCAPEIERQYQQYMADQQLESCQKSLTDQYQLWKEAMVSATGVLGTVGMTIGGAGAVLAGGAIALGKGAAMGVSSALPMTTTTISTSMQRSVSADQLRIANPDCELAAIDHCLKCAGVERDKGVRTRHIYRGDCTGLPFSAYIAKRRPALGDQSVPPVGGGHPPEQPAVHDVNQKNHNIYDNTSISHDMEMPEPATRLSVGSFASLADPGSVPQSADVIEFDSPVNKSMLSNPADLVDAVLDMQTQLTGLMEMMGDLQRTVQ